jgi:hypothetical protein
MRFEVRETAGLARSGEPVSIGLPCPQGRVLQSGAWQLCDDQGKSIPAELEPLARWPDGSVRWLLVRALITMRVGEQRKYHLSPNEVHVDTTPTGAESRPSHSIFTSIDQGLGWGFRGDYEDSLTPATLEVVTPRGDRVSSRTETRHCRGRGVVSERWSSVGDFPGCSPLRFQVEVEIFQSGRLARIAATLWNPSRAKHSDGYWDLGDPGSVLLRGASLSLTLDTGRERTTAWRERPRDPTRNLLRGKISITQESSGGEAWNSRTHVDASKQVRLPRRGYRAEAAGGVIEGERATPIVAVQGSSIHCAATLADFWEMFPSGIDAEVESITMHLLPQQQESLHEIQGGERLTRVTWWTLAEGGSCVCDQLAWVYEPLAVIVDPQAVYESGVIFGFPAKPTSETIEARTLLQRAIVGPDSFFAKRETIDEYGWRHYGDMWADHEQAYYEGNPPAISHYNNQYDILHGLQIQQLLTGQPEWRQLAQPLARHVVDVDIYHAPHDKSAYAGGLFWHTAHYHDAATATHRSMSRQMRGRKLPAPGGGPGNEHNYASGLALHYFLTGEPASRQAVIDLADWVIAMDDGRQHLLGLVSDSPTGFASATSQPHYHGPGRGAGNSINTLLDAWLVSDEPQYLAKAEQLIQRTIHPRDDLAARELSNAELRWSYTVHLQALCRFHDMVPPEQVGRELHAYIVASLLHYGRWMVEHERNFLDSAENLEYPTETWAAQDLRKANVLEMIARFCSPEERSQFQERGREIRRRAWRQLLERPSCIYTRPLALVLQQVYFEQWLSGEDGSLTLQAPLITSDFGEPVEFIPQKAQVKQLLRNPLGLACALPRLLRPSRYWDLFRRSWKAARLRRLLGRTGVAVSPCPHSDFQAKV